MVPDSQSLCRALASMGYCKEAVLSLNHGDQLNYRCKFTWIGIIYGSVFVFVALIIDLSIAGLMPTLGNIIQIHLDNPITYVIDTAPLVLGIGFYYLGEAYQRLYNRSTELRDSRARLKAVMESASDAIIAIDEHGGVLEFNTAAETAFGFKRQEAIGNNLERLIIPHRYRDAYSSELKRFLETGEAPLIGQRVELEALHQDGHEFPVEVAIEKTQPSSSNVAVVGFIRDITDRRKAEHEQNEIQLAQQHIEGVTKVIQLANAPIFGIDT